MIPNLKSAGADRFLYIDGLRGIAAIMVAIAHLVLAAELKHPGLFGSLGQLGDFGRYGVQIFFVLSGFVIAHSVSGGLHTWGFFGRFVSRRAIRLDLPYWLVIALEIGLLWLSGQVMAAYARELPSWPQIISNMMYLQMFLGYEHILPIFWTLCYEVQFYLAFVASLVLLGKIQQGAGTDELTRRIGPAALAISFVVSLLIYVGVIPTLHEALFDDRWFQFVLGVITYSYFRGRCSWKALAAANLACLIAAFTLADTDYRITSLLFTAGTSLTIVAAIKRQLWRDLLSGPTLQFLGRTSYSLYLLHLPIGWRVVVLLRELIGERYNVVTGAAIFVIGILASVIAAAVAYVVVERPAMNLAKRIKLPKLGEAPILTPQPAPERA